MGLSLKDIQLRLCKMIHVSIDTSYKFIQRHPLVSGASLVFLILYLFLNYIYSFLLYLFPFLFCIAILIRVFWSSDQTQLRYVRREEIKKREQKINEPRYPKIPRYERCGTVPETRYKYSSQRALSRRRNFGDKRWEVAGDADEKSKTSSAGSNNAVPDSSIGKKEWHSSVKEESPSESAGKYELRSELSLSDLVEVDSGDKNTRFDGIIGGSELDPETMEDVDDDDDEEEAHEDGNKAVEWTEDDQKNLMDLGLSEMERNKRLESLIARRKARKMLKSQIEKGLIDIRNITPSQLAPVYISPRNPSDSSIDFDPIDCLEMPGSAPSVLPTSRNPFDLPYDSSEEKPILTGDSFDQEFTIGNHKEMITYCRHESFSLGPCFPIESKQDQGDTEAYTFFFNGRKASGHSRMRRSQDMGNHDWLIEQLFSKGAHQMAPSRDKHDESNSETEPPVPLGNEEVIKYEVARENEKEMTEIKGDGDENDIITKSMLEDRSEPVLPKNNNYGFAEIGQKIPNVEGVEVSEIPKSIVLGPYSNHLNCLIPNGATMHECILDSFQVPFAKTHENVCDAEKRLSHTRTGSIASDLQVEVSEIGSVDETNTTTDGESAVYDGDIDKDIITYGSDDVGGISFNSRGVRGIIEEDMGISEVENNLTDASTILLEQIDEANAAYVSSGETSTHGISFGNIFGNEQNEAVAEIKEPQPVNSSGVSSPPKQLMPSPLDHPPHEAHSENLELDYSSEHLKNEAKLVNDVNDSATTENDDTEKLQSIEDPGTSHVQQGSMDGVSANSSSSLSPRSVLPEKTMTDQNSSTTFDLIHADVPQPDIDDISLITPTAELPPEKILQNMQYFMSDSFVQTDDDFSNFQEGSYLLDMADYASTSYTFREPIFYEQKMADGPSTSNIWNKYVFDDQEENYTSDNPLNQETADSPVKSTEDEPASVITHDVDLEIPTHAEMTTLEDLDEKSRGVVEKKATTEPSKMTWENDNSTTTEDTKMSGPVTEDETIPYHGNHVDDGEVDIETKQGIQVDFQNLTESEGVHNLEKLGDETNSISTRTTEEVPSDSLRLQSSLGVPNLNIESESSMRQENTVEPFVNAQVTSSRSTEDIQGKHDELSQHVDINQPTGEQPNDRSEERRYSQNGSKEEVETHTEKDEMTSDTVTKDFPQSIMTEFSNLSSGEDSKGKPNEMNNKEPIKEEPEKNDVMISVGEGDKLTNISHTVENDELVQVDRSQGEGYVQSESKLIENDKEKVKLENGDISKDSPQ